MRLLLLFFVLLQTTMAFGLSYQVITPKNLRPHPTLVTLLHGCTQTINQIKGLTSLESLVEEKNLILLLPTQSLLRNPAKCWNWFLPRNNDDAYGELATLKLLIKDVMERFETKGSYLYGFSAGAAMASNLIALNSQLFDGVLLHSGFPYQGLKTFGLDIDLAMIEEDQPLDNFLMNLEQQQYQQVSILRSVIRPLDPRLKNIIIVSGVKDLIASYRHSKSTFLQFSDESSLLSQRSFDHYNIYQSSGERKVYLYEFLTMGHAWSGGNDRYFYASPDTLDITSESFEIFKL